MSNDAESFYDKLANQYHLIGNSWKEATKRQGDIIHQLLEDRYKLRRKLKILDCSCGIGTQAIGLALRGHEVVGTDISSKEVEKARMNANELDLKISFRICDFRNLKSEVEGEFDVVLSFDNAIAHLQTPEDLEKALKSMHSKLNNNGLLMVSVRDYQQITQEKPTGTPPKTIEDEHGKRIYFQTWDWSDDYRSYNLNLFILKKEGDFWKSSPVTTKMRAWTKDEIFNLIEKNDWKNAEWLAPSDSNYYQPIVALRKES